MSCTLAKTVREHAPRARALLGLALMLHTAVARAAPPEAPVVPASLAPAVKAARGILAKLRDNCLQVRSRNGEWYVDEEEYDTKKCATYLAALMKPDEAVVHAIGQGALSPSFSPEGWGGAMAEWPGLVAHLGEVGSPLAVQYLVRAAFHLGKKFDEDSEDPEYMSVIVDALRLATGNDVGRMPPWEIDEDTPTKVRTNAADIGKDWAAWYAVHSAETPEQWRAAGLAASRLELSSPDPIVRFTAIERQLGTGGDHEAALRSLESALSDPLVSAGFVDRAARFLSVGAPSELYDRAGDARQAAVAALPAGPDGSVAALPRTAPNVKRLLAACTKAFDQLRLRDAMDACSAAAKADPKNVTAEVGRGWVQLEVGDTAAAKATAEVALANKPGSVGALQLAAAVATVEGDAAKARAWLESAAKTNADARQRLGILNGQPPAKTWVRYIAPRHACWKRRGNQASNAFLLRRGINDPAAFEQVWATLPKREKAKLTRKGVTGCPFQADQAKRTE